MDNKIILEKVSELKIRKGFEKLIDKALLFFNIKNIQEISKQDAEKIIKFINKSNTKLHESYYALRTNLTKEEYMPLVKQYGGDWVKTSYKYTNRSTTAKKHNSLYKSRGYSGYVEINNIKYYCRSSVEYVYLLYLCMYKYNKTYYRVEMENIIYHFNDISYKPDIFIYQDNVLIKIYEIKSDKTYLQDEKYHQAILYFKQIGIDYEIIDNLSDILKSYPDIKNKLKEWKIENALIHHDMRGKNNPMYGIKHSDKTKEKIRNAAKERFANEAYRYRYKELMKRVNTNRDHNKTIRSRLKNKIKKVNLDISQITNFGQLVHIYLNYKIKLNEETLIKYFLNIDNFKKELING